MAEAIHSEIPNEINQTDLANENAQQMVELKRPLLSSPEQQRQEEEEMEDDEVTIDVKEMIQDCGDGVLVPECCIYRVPSTLCLNEEDSTPKLVSIGPFHYGNEKLPDMKRHKQVLFKRFTERTTSSMDDLIRLVKHLEPKVRASYSEILDLTQQQLVKLTLVDAAFIIELFMSWFMAEWKNDAKLSQPWLRHHIYNDLLLLENQLPFFVIEELFNKAFPHNHHGSSHLSFLELAYRFFGYHNTQELEPDPDVKIKHFTDLLRLFFLPIEKAPRRSFSNASHILLYNANALQQAGIKLKVSESKCLLDLKFSGHILEIPQIQVEVTTKLLFGNVLALELCHYPNASYFADYVRVLDWLIDTSKDADLLVHNKIVRNYFGDTNNVALLFNSLTESVIHSTFSSEYLDTCKRLNDYCQNRWHNMRATLRRDYCHTTWQIVASIAAIVLLFLTVIQTIFSILQVVL